MTSLEKLIERLQRRPTEADFTDLRRLLEHFGWTQSRHHGKGTSHVTFTKSGERAIITLALMSGRTVKREYVDKVLEQLGLEE